MTTMREASKKEWTSADTREDINAGSLQRIADACELMAKNYTTLIVERARYERWYKEERELRTRRDRQIAALRGVITRMKKEPRL